MKQFEKLWEQGSFSRQAHRDLPEGTFERELGRDGFAGPASHMYHKRPPTSWDAVEGDLKPRAFDLNQSETASHMFAAAVLLHSPSLNVGMWFLHQSTDCLVRNADGDDLLFVHEGQGDLFCDYGHLSIHPGDYVVIPRGTMWRLDVSGLAKIFFTSTIGQRLQIPERGLLGQHALWDPGVVDVPQIDFAFRSQEDTPWNVVVKKQARLSMVKYKHNPLDAVGWKGNLCVWRLNIRDLLPVTSHRYHLPPSAHATFECDTALVSTFVPRPFETDRTALKVPFFHNNDDIDEVLFYHAGNFFSRDSIHEGYLTLHPSGLTHGPHPNALKHMFHQEQSETNEYAVLLDSREPLLVNEDLASKSGLELPNYASSWRAA